MKATKYPAPKLDLIPEGFGFESAYRSGGTASVTWTSGYNSLTWTVSDMTQAVVNMRADYSSEPGDAGIRMNFGVHYSAAELLVEIDSKGVAPEWVYEQLIELGE